MTRAYTLLLLAVVASPLLAAEPGPLSFGPPGDPLPEGAKFRLGRPTGYMTTIFAFSADGKTLAATTNRGYTGGIEAPVDLWDVETGKHIRTLRYHKTGVMATAFSRDGTVTATSGIDNKLRFWDGKTGKDITKEEIPLTGHGYNLHFSPDGKRLLVGSTKLEMYDVGTQQPIKRKEGYFAETANNNFFHTATWSPKGKYVAAACDGHGVRVWEAETGNLVHKITPNYVVHRTRFEFSADDKLLLLSTWPKGLFSVYDVETGKEQTAVKPPAGESASEQVQFAREMGRAAWLAQTQPHQPGGNRVVVADATGQELKRFEVPVGVLSHRLSGDGKRLAVSCVDGSLRIYEAESGKLERAMVGGWSPVFRSVYTDSGKVLRTVHLDGTVHDFDADTGKHLKERTLALKGQHLITVSADGALLASATEDGTCTIWNLATGEVKAKPNAKLFVYREPQVGFGRPFPLPPGPVPPPGAVPPGPPAVGPEPAPALVAQPAQPVAPGVPPPQPVEQPGPPQFFASFSADGKLFVALTGKEEEIIAWDTANGEVKHTIKTPKGATAVALSADGAHLFAGYGRVGSEPAQPDEKAKEAVALRRFEVKTGKEVQTWKALAVEKRQNLQHLRTEVTALYPLPDKETVVAVESQVFTFWPPAPGALGGPRAPGQRFAQARVINLPGREKEKLLEGAGDSLLTISPDGKAVAFMANDLRDPNKPVVLVKVFDVASGKAKSATVASGPHIIFGEKNRDATFRPNGKDITVRTGDGTVLVLDAGAVK